MSSENKKKISIIIPVQNEQENIAPLASRLMSVITTLTKYSFEVFFVDDGSDDGTISEIEKWIGNKFPIGYIKLARNFGHQAALEAGLTVAKGDAIITMDGDMQHPPEEIPVMLKNFEEGADAVQMQRENIPASLKGILTQLFHFFFKIVSNSTVVPDSADFRLISRKVRDQLLLDPSRGKIFRSIIPSLGFRQTILPFRQETRKLGKPSYSYLKLYELALYIVFKSSRFPAHFTLTTGLALITGSVFSLLFVYTGVIEETANRIMFILFFLLCGCVFFAAGIISWYLFFILEQVSRSPVFLIEKICPPADKP